MSPVEPLRRLAAVLVAAGCLAAAAASLLVPAAPGYDAWAWLLWGREVAALELSTVEGPAFKPLPVAVSAVLSLAGDAAPDLWLVLARAAALAAVALAAAVAATLVRDVLGARAGGWPLLAGGAAAAGVACTERFAAHAAAGDGEPAMLAAALGAFVCARRGRHGWALGLGVLAALLRPETWPFLAAYGVWRWRADPRLRPALVGAAVLVPVAWFLPEWLGSGELLRSSDRAQVPNPGAPALADRPALYALGRAAGLAFVPAVAGLAGVAAVRRAGPRLLVAAAVAWLALVAGMSEAGFSGEERYALPGVALLAVPGAAGLALLARRGGPAATAGAVLLVGAFTATGAVGIAELGPGLADGARLARDLPGAIRAAGGRAVLLGCGRPAVGRFRGPMLAYHLRVHKHVVRADGAPAAVTFRSRLGAGRPVTPPPVPGARTLAQTARWRVEADCTAPIPSAAIGLVRVP